MTAAPATPPVTPGAPPVSPPTTPAVGPIGPPAIPAADPPATPGSGPATRLVGIAEASAALGISQSVIRRRLKDGRLRGERRHTPQGHVWLVHVPEPSRPGAGAAEAAAEAVPPPTAPSADGGHAFAELAAAREAVARLEAHNADLRTQVETLAGELAARRREVTELHTLVGMVSRALPAPATPSASPAADPVDSPATPAADPPASPAADRSAGPSAESSPDREAGRAADPSGNRAAVSPWWRRVWGWLTAG
jgi:hypothetical protein